MPGFLQRLIDIISFNIPTLSTKFSSEQTQRVVTQLHSILKPFLLRRLKADVEYNLPPKKEYILYAPITEHQKGLYEAVVNGAIRRWLINEKSGSNVSSEKQNPQHVEAGSDDSADDRPRILRRRSEIHRPVYNFDEESDNEYFERVAKGDFNAFEEAEESRRWGHNRTGEVEGEDVGVEHIKRTAGRLPFYTQSRGLF